MEYTEAQCKTFLAKAYEVASQSQDPSTQVGAIVMLGNVLQMGTAYCNAPSFGIELTEEDWNDRAKKLTYVHHAERSAIDAAARGGLWLDGAVLVAPWAACTECAKTIVASGVSTLIRHKVPDDDASKRWAESIAEGDKIMQAGGVKIIEVDGPIPGAPKVLRGGTLFDPAEE